MKKDLVIQNNSIIIDESILISIKTIKEEHVLSLLLYHELLKELKNVK